MSSLRSRIARAAVLALLPLAVATGHGAPATAAVTSEPPARLVAAGPEHSCAVDVATTVRCWGANDDGQLGDGSTQPSVAPVSVVGLTGATEVAVGRDHSCAVLATRTVSCWGANWGGQLGDGTGVDTSTPVAVSGLDDVVGISAGEYHTCAMRSDATLWCWGFNDDGQIGDGTLDPALSPFHVVAVTDVVAIAAGYAHTCAVSSSGAIACWGANGYGQLGDGTDIDALVPVAVSGITDAASIDAGYQHTCAIHRDGAMSCWGDNERGQLGDGTLTQSAVPRRVAGMTAATQVAIGDDVSCALLETGVAQCWGDRYHGTLGDGGDTDLSTIAVDVTGVSDAIAIAVGDRHGCVARSDGGVACWGDSPSGQIGSGLPADLRTPARVATVESAARVIAADNATCVVHLDATMSCWGENWSGQLGRGTDTQADVPAPVPGLTDVADATGGGDHVCARRTDGSVACWGRNIRGNLGDGTRTSTSSPVEVATTESIERITAGDEHTCAITTSDAVLCWGEGFYGALGTGTTSDQTVPTVVTGLAATAIDAGGTGTCARDLTGTVLCWGRNDDGEVGDGTTSQRNAPVAIATAPNTFARITVGQDHACASRPSGLMCWGDNDFGQLGDGTRTGRVAPTAVVGGTPGRIEGGGDHTCVLASGAVRCWGENYSGQLGDGSTVSWSTAPVDVTGVTDATDLALGAEHSCIVRTDATVWCWGSNTWGQLGDLPYRTTPTRVVGVTVPVPAAAPATAALTPLTPARLLDTRPGQPTTDGRFSGGGALAAGTTLELQVAGRGNVSADAVAAVLNVTAVDAIAPGFVTAYPCDAPRPLASGLNYAPGAATPNEVIARLSPTGTVCLYALAQVHLVVDATGFAPPGSPYEPLVPARLLDTRPGEPTTDGRFAGAGRRPAGSTLELPVTGRGGVPADASAVVVNVAAVGATAPGFVTVSPCDAARPLASSLNVEPGTVTPNEIVARVSATGTICLYTLVETDLLVDVTGALPDGQGYAAMTPARFLDTRPGATTVDGQQAGQGVLTGGRTLTLPITGRNGMTAASAVTVNVTAIGTSSPGFVTVYPCDQPRPLASSLNVTPGRATPNEIVARLAAAGTICLYTLTDVDLVVDVTGSVR